MRMGFRGNVVLILKFRGRRFIERESKLRSVSRGDSGQTMGPDSMASCGNNKEITVHAWVMKKIESETIREDMAAHD